MTDEDGIFECFGEEEVDLGYCFFFGEAFGDFMGGRLARENDVFDVGTMAVDGGRGVGGVFVAFGGVGTREAEGLGSSGVVVV